MLASRPLDEPDPPARVLGSLADCDLEILADCDLEMLSMVLIERPSEAKKAMMLPCAQAAEMVLGPDPTHVSADERGTPGMALMGPGLTPPPVQTLLTAVGMLALEGTDDPGNWRSVMKSTWDLGCGPAQPAAAMAIRSPVSTISEAAICDESSDWTD